MTPSGTTRLVTDSYPQIKTLFGNFWINNFLHAPLPDLPLSPTFETVAPPWQSLPLGRTDGRSDSNMTPGSITKHSCLQ